MPKGRSFDPQEKRMAIHVEDPRFPTAALKARSHPGSTAADRGTWEPVGDPREGRAKGKLLFKLHGEKLAGL